MNGSNGKAPQLSQGKPIKSSFFEYLLADNRPQMAGFARWILHPGMAFNSLETWWGEKKPRPSPHEGMDLCCFEDSSGQVRQVGQDLKIPATFAGEVLQLAPDFLGKSIYLGHEILAADGRRFAPPMATPGPWLPLKSANRWWRAK